jgi:biopolymer transport protein TolR
MGWRKRPDAPVVYPAASQRSSEMNVTPLIDVMLVLLVLFMVALPLTQTGLDADLPEAAQPSAAVETDPSQIVAEYSADHRLTINKRPVDVAAAGAAFREVFAGRRDKTLYVIGDGTVRYGEIARVIDAAIGAGVTSVGIVTEGMRREVEAARTTPSRR